ncbi:MAG: glycosyltransferase family 2 protein [Patescibacteria group bacterium]|nr:glycosyltransferase family 2 protein [Patescibacteria group bacterium]
MVNKPKISIVTASFNSQSYIKKAIDSVLSQDYENIEYIVIDGGSTDGTLEILSSYGDKIKWISEKDKGIYDALTKGFEMATGEIISWLDSDNYYFSSYVLSTVAESFNNNKIDLVVMNSYVIYPEYDRKIEHKPISNINYKTLLCQGNKFIPEGLFYKKSLYEKVGGLNLEFKLLADYELWLKFFESNIKFLNIDKYSSVYTVRRDALLRKSPFKSWHESFVIGKKYNRPYFFRVYFRILYLRALLFYPIKKLLKKSDLFTKFYRKYNSL